MLAPPIQQSITFFFSPILPSAASASSTTITATTSNQLKDRQNNYLTLRPAWTASSRSPMKKRRLSRDVEPKKIKTSNIKDIRSVQDNSSQPLVKRQKLDSEEEERVKGSLKTSNSTLEGSRVDNGYASTNGIKYKDNSAVQPLPNGTVIDNGMVKSTQRKANQKLKVETKESFNNHSSGKVTEIKSSPKTQGTDDNKRSLRSHDGGSRSKSELAQYFPNFDEIINPDIKEKELLTARTRLFVTDEPTKSSDNASFVVPTPTRTRAPSSVTSPLSPQQQTRLPTMDDMKFEKIELPSLKEVPETDPLGDPHYEVAHRRAERQEKQLRNIERERAQHEKVQLERLQEGLLGPDWLKVMGISGVVEGDRKKWDDAREYFLKEVKCLLDKFAQWKEEERRRKLLEVKKRREAEEAKGEKEDEENKEEEKSISAESSMDAAAHQLQQENLSATAGSKGKKSQGKKPGKKNDDAEASVASPKRLPKTKAVELIPPVAAGPFTSFFAKPHQRAAALDRSRRTTGRTKWAFGHPVPDMPEMAFTLPKSMVSAEARKASARLRRGMRRGRD